MGTTIATFDVRVGTEIDVSSGLNQAVREVSTAVGAINRAADGIKPIAPDLGLSTARADVDRAVLALKALQAEVKVLGQNAAGAHILEVDESQLELATGVLKSMKVEAELVARAMGQLAAQTSQVAASAQQAAAAQKELAAADQALRSRVALMTEGVRIQATQAESLRALATMYVSVSREIGAGNVPLERRIALERELARIRQSFSTTTPQPIASPVPPIPPETPRRIAEAARSFALINRETGAFTPLGQRAASASVAFGFGLEALARGGAAAEGGLRTALRAIASVAAAFGPEGLIVSGVAASTAAIIDLFTKSREEAEKTRKAFEEEVGRMIRSADTIGLQKKIQEIDVGDPTKGLSKFGDFFKGGRLDLSAQFDDLTARITKLKAGAESFGRNASLLGLSTQLREVRKQLAPMQEEWNLLVRTLKNFPTLPREVTGLAPVSVTANSPARQAKEDAEAAAKALSDLESQVRRLLEAGRAGGGVSPDTTAIPDALTAAYDQATAALARHGKQLDEVGLRLRAIIRDLRETDAVQVALARRQFSGGVEFLQRDVDAIASQGKIKPIPVPVTPTIEAVDLTRLREQVQRADVLKGLVDLSKAGGNDTLARQMQALLDDARAQAEQTAGVIARVLATSGIPAAQQTAILQQIKAALAGIAKDGGDAADAFNAIAVGTRGLTEVGNRLGFISDQASEAIDAVLSLAQAIQSIRGGSALGIAGGIAGAVGGIASIISSITAESPLEREHNQLLSQNNEEIARLRQDFAGFSNTIGNQQRVARALVSPGVLSAADLLKSAGGIDSVANLGMDVLRDSLTQFGLTIADINRIAKENGIQLLDSEGRVVGGALKQLGEVLKINTDLLTRFGKSLDEQRSALDLRREVFDLDTDPTQGLRDQLTLLAKFFPSLATTFQGLDASTAQGRDAIEAAFRALTQALIDGTIPIEAFAGVMSKEDLIAIIRDADRALDSFTETTNAATEALRNVPNWFKIAGFRFAAAAPIGIGPTSVPGPSPVPILPSVATLSASEAQRLTTGPTSVTFSGDIIIQAAPGDDGAALYAKWRREVERRAGASSSPDTRRFLTVLPA